MQMPTPLSMSMPRPRTRPRTRPRARPMTSQGQGQGHCLRDINTQLSPFCIFSIFLVFLKRLVFCVVSVILRVRCYLHLRWHYWPHSGWFQISGVSRKVSFEVWDPTQGVLGFQGLVQSQFLVASWKFKCWCFLDPPTGGWLGRGGGGGKLSYPMSHPDPSFISSVNTVSTVSTVSAVDSFNSYLAECCSNVDYPCQGLPSVNSVSGGRL